MRKVLAAVGLAAAIGGGLVTASAAAGPGSQNDGGGGVSTLAIGGAAAPNARIAAFVNAGGNVARSKGISAVTHPSLGLYCLKPSGLTATAVSRIVPVVSVDWSSSLGDALMAHWRSSNIGCPAGNIAILTMDGEDGTFDLSNGVSFTVVVP